MSDNKPIASFNDRGSSITVWHNEGDDRPPYAFKVDRAFKDADGNWQHTNIFSEDDMLRLSRLTTKAYDHVQDHKREFSRSASRNREPGPQDDNPTSDVGYADDRKREPARQRGRQYRR